MAQISEKKIPDQTVASIKKVQSLKHVGSFISASAISLIVYAKELGISPNGRGFTIHKPAAAEGEAEVEVCLPVSKSGQDRGDIHFREVKGGTAASSVAKGSYEKVPDAHAAMKKGCESKNQKVTEVREVYLKGPQETKDSSQWETELLYFIS